MEMFESSLFNYFIPEILMVIGYLFCMIGPNIHADKVTTELTPVTIQVSSETEVSANTYKLTYQDFQQVQCAGKPENKLFEAFETVDSFINFTYSGDISDGSKLSIFCRPPPAFFI